MHIQFVPGHEGIEGNANSAHAMNTIHDVYVSKEDLLKAVDALLTRQWDAYSTEQVKFNDGKGRHLKQIKS